MTQSHKPRSIKRAGKGLIFAILGVAVLAVGGFAAYKVLFNRPGEAATLFIPSDADVVITLDTSPSERQVLTFNKISNALQEQGITKEAEGMLKSLMDGSPIAAEIRPNLSTSFAMAYWKAEDPGQPQKMAVLMAVKDASAVKTSLSKLPSTKDGYTLPNNSGTAAMVDNYLAIASSPAILSQIQAVQSKQQSSIADNAAFSEARGALPSDANVMIFISPRLLQDLGKTAASLGSGVSPFNGVNWASFSMTVEPEGIAFDYYGPTNANAMPGMKNIAGIAPLSIDAFKKLPEGAIGFAAYSQPGKYWDYAKEASQQDSHAKEGFDSGIAQLEKETGLSLEKDIVPALNGEVIVAFYPAGSAKTFDGDVVGLFTDENGATPADLAQKIRSLIEQKSKENGHKGITFTEEKMGDATVWEIDAASRQELLKEAKGSGAEAPAQLQSKSILLATQGQNVILASSRPILNRVLNNTGRNLMEDPSFAVIANELERSPQGLFAVNLRKLAESLRPMYQDSMKDSPMKVDEMINLFGDGAMPLYVVGKYDGKTGTGRLMIPLNYETLIKMIGTTTKGMGDTHQPVGPDGVPMK